MFVGDGPGSAFLDFRGGGDGGGVVDAAAGDDEPFAPGADRAVVVGPGGLGPGGGGQEPDGSEGWGFESLQAHAETTGAADGMAT